MAVVRLKVVRTKTKAEIEALTDSIDGAQYWASDAPNIYLGNGGVPVPYGTGDVATEIHAATSKATPVNADEIGIWDSVSGLLRKVTWSNIKATLKTYFDGLYTAKNTAITGATKTKITYDSKGLVTNGADATTADITASTDKNYVTDAEVVVIGNTSGTNTGDQDLSGLQGKALTTGKMWQGVAGVAAEVDPPSSGGVSFGTNNQIPHMNSDGTDFDYDANFVWDGIRLELNDGNNTLIGDSSTGAAISTGSWNLGIGIDCFNDILTGLLNTAIGVSSLSKLTSGDHNTSLGYRTGYYNNGSYNLFLGNDSGFYETGSYSFIIDTISRASESTGRTSALLYGIFSATVADQELNINATTKTKRLVKAYQTLISSTGITMNEKLGQNAKCTLAHSTTITFTNIESGDEGNIDIVKDATATLRNIVFAHATLPIKIIRSEANSFDLTSSGQNRVFSYVCNGDDIKITYGEDYG